MNEKQKQQFNQMLTTLRAIAKKSQSPQRLKRQCKKDYWFDYEEALEMEYENIRVEATSCIRGIKQLS